MPGDDMRHKLLKIFVAFVGITLLSNSTAHADSNNSYPDAWWQPVPREEAASWEILPQDAGPGEVILSKRTALGVFSNFAATEIRIDSVSYPCVEAFWQMMKFPESDADPRATYPGIHWPHTRADVAKMDGFASKRAGSAASEVMKKMNINWVTYQGKRLVYRTPNKSGHYQLILRAMRAKLAQHPEVQQLLLQTGNLKLRPDHHQEPDVSPAWRYFDIWMELRSELQQGP